MKRALTIVLLLAALPAAAADDDAKLKVVATLPDVGSIARAVGGDRVEVTTLALGYQDPHYVTPTPALMNAVSRADLFLEVGLSLEIWSERVLDGARNSKVRVGRPGHQFVSSGIRVLAVPKVVTRAQGDLHPQGNPHIWLDPLNGLLMARNTRDALTRVAPQHGPEFEANYIRFRDRLHEALYGAELTKLLGGPVLEKLDRAGKLIGFLTKKKLKGVPLIERLGGMHRTALAFRGKRAIFYHQSWVYFADRFGLDIRGYVEDKPGIAPSARHRDDLIALVKAEKIPVVAVTNYYPKRVPKAICEATGAKLVVLPNATGGEEGAGEYIPFLELLVGRLAEAYR
jgi:zinc/manganese transport system substrate-binding protein